MAKFKCNSRAPLTRFMGYSVSKGKIVDVSDASIADKFRRHQDFEELLSVKKEASKKHKKSVAADKSGTQQESKKETFKE